MNRLMMAAIITGCTLILAACTKQSITTMDDNDQIVIWRENILKTEELSKEQKILSVSSSYTFFLFPQTKWLEGGRRRDIADLYQAYKDYGRAITNDNLAVWFWDSKNDWEPNTVIASDFIYNLNQVKDCRSNCLTDGQDLDINGGPFIVYLRTSEPKSISITKSYRDGGTIKSISRIQLQQIMNLASKGLVSDLFILDFQHCGMEGTQQVLHLMETNIRHGYVPQTPDVNQARLKCEIVVSAKKLGKLYDWVLSRLEEITKLSPMLSLKRRPVG